MPFHSQIINFLKKDSLRNKHTFMTINASWEGICVKF